MNVRKKGSLTSWNSDLSKTAAWVGGTTAGGVVITRPSELASNLPKDLPLANRHTCIHLE